MLPHNNKRPARSHLNDCTVAAQDVRVRISLYEQCNHLICMLSHSLAGISKRCKADLCRLEHDKVLQEKKKYTWLSNMLRAFKTCRVVLVTT